MGVDRPLDLRLTDVTVIDQAGGRRMNIPRAEVSLSIYALLFGRVVPRAVDVGCAAADSGAGGRWHAQPRSRQPDRGGRGRRSRRRRGRQHRLPTCWRSWRVRPAATGRTVRTRCWDSSVVVRIHDARVVVVDRHLGVTWRAPHAEIDLARRPEGGVDGTAELGLAVGEQQARLTLSATLAAGASETHLRARLSPVTPSVIARAAPSLAALAALDAPVGGEATFDLDASLALRDHAVEPARRRRPGADRRRQRAVSRRRAGGLGHAGGARACRRCGSALPGHVDGPPTHVETRGTLRRSADRISADMSLDLDQVDFADLSRLWPEGTGGGARRWLVANIPVGIARNGHVDLGLAASRGSVRHRADARERHAGRRRACRCTGCGRFRRSTTARRSCALSIRTRWRSPSPVDDSACATRRRQAPPACRSAAAGCASPASCSRTRSA